MHEQGLKLSLDIMDKDHCNTNLLLDGIGGTLTVYLFLQKGQETSDQDWPKVFNQEDLLAIDNFKCCCLL